MEHSWLAAGGGVGPALLALLGLWRRRSSAERRSRWTHEAARGREPPVGIGGTHEFGVTEFTDHHSGERVAVRALVAEDEPSGRTTR